MFHFLPVLVRKQRLAFFGPHRICKTTVIAQHGVIHCWSKQTGDVSSEVFFDANASRVLLHLVSIQYPALANLDRCTCASNEGALRLKLDFLAHIDLEHYLLKLMPSIFRSFFICLKCVCSKFQVVSWIERLWSVGQKIPVFDSFWALRS